MGGFAWDAEEIKVLRKMWKDGHSSMAIGDVLGKKPSSVRQYVKNNREDLGLSPRKRTDVMPYKNVSEFDKQWYGSVPFCHWSITKPWGTT
jgi:hypothetical protein